MLDNIEYNFRVLKYTLLEGILKDFTYDISVYYKDFTSGHFAKTSTYTIDKHAVNLSSVDDLLKIVLELEKVDSFQETSIFKSALKGLKTKIVDCSAEWSITNTKKFS